MATTINLRRSADYDDWFAGYEKFLWSDGDNPQFAYVPDDVRIGSLNGNTSHEPDRFMIKSDASTQRFSDEVTITGYGLGGKVVPLAFSNRFADAENPLSDVPGEAGLGVFDIAGRWAGQIDYYEDHPIHGSGGEKMVIDFGGTVTKLKLTASMVGSGEEGRYDESGKWTAYDANGEVIGTGYIGPDFGSATGSKGAYGEYAIPVEASAPIAKVAIEAIAFDRDSGSGYSPAASGVRQSDYTDEQGGNPHVKSTENNSDIGLSAISYDRVNDVGGTPPEPAPEPAADAAPVVYRMAGEREFDGSSGAVIKAGSPSELEIVEGSIAFRFDSDDVDGRHALVSKDAWWYEGGGNHFSSWTEDGALTVRFEDENRNADFKVGGISAGSTHEVIATFDDEEVGVYVDGRLIGTKDLVMDWTENTQGLEIGGFGWTERDAFDGTISDVIVFDEVITPEDYGAIA